MTPLQSKLRGVLGFSVTPFHEDLSVDNEALERHISWMAGRKFCALVVAGGAGDVYSLTVAEAAGLLVMPPYLGRVQPGDGGSAAWVTTAPEPISRSVRRVTLPASQTSPQSSASLWVRPV